jgi:hypothetical protein
MKAIRITAELLLILAGIIHFVLFFVGPIDENAQLYLVFGIFYFAIGMLMFVNQEFSAAWGIIFPLIGLGGGIFVIGLQQWNMMLAGLFAIDAIIIICCSILYLKMERN